MIILKSEIDSLFLHAWIQYHKITIDQLELKLAKQNSKVQKYEITNEIVLRQLEDDYKSFSQSKQSVEDFLEIDSLIFKENSQGHFNAVKTKCLDRPIVILCQKKNSRLFILDIPLSELRSAHPIEMSMSSILSIYGIKDTVDILPLAELNIYGFEDEHQVCIDIYKLNGNKCQKYWNVPGNRYPPWIPNHRISIAVDKLDIPYLPKFYWIPCDSLITKNMSCTKLPGVCVYSTTNIHHLKTHELTCSDETKIESKQVIEILLQYRYPCYRFHMVLMMTDSTS